MTRPVRALPEASAMPRNSAPAATQGDTGRLVSPLRRLAELFSEASEIISSLATVTGLGVISRSSAMRYKGSDLPLEEIAAALEVAHAVAAHAVPALAGAVVAVGAAMLSNDAAHPSLMQDSHFARCQLGRNHQGVSQAIVDEDAEAAAAAARRVGAAAQQGVPPGLVGKLPIEFKRLGFDTHQRFDQLAMNIETFGETGQALPELAELMKNCTGCHAAYRFELEQP